MSATWTATPPTEPNWYWQRDDAGEFIGLVDGAVKAGGSRRFGPAIPSPDELAAMEACVEKIRYEMERDQWNELTIEGFENTYAALDALRTEARDE